MRYPGHLPRHRLVQASQIQRQLIETRQHGNHSTPLNCSSKNMVKLWRDATSQNSVSGPLSPALSTAVTSEGRRTSVSLSSRVCTDVISMGVWPRSWSSVAANSTGRSAENAMMLDTIQLDYNCELETGLS